MQLEKFTTGKGKEVMRYPKLYGKQRQQQKRDESEARQVEHDKLTLKEKAARAVPDSKEHTRLLAQIEKAKS
jgi:hypothetical protein